MLRRLGRVQSWIQLILVCGLLLSMLPPATSAGAQATQRNGGIRPFAGPPSHLATSVLETAQSEVAERPPLVDGLIPSFSAGDLSPTGTFPDNLPDSVAQPSHLQSGVAANPPLPVTVHATEEVSPTQPISSTDPLSPTVPVVTATVIYDPLLGGRLESPDGRIAVELPPGAAAEPLQLTFAERAGFQRGDSDVLRIFDLSAETVLQRQTVERFSRPITLTARYDPAELGTLFAGTLHFQYVDDATGWKVPVSSTVDQTNFVVTAVIDHFSSWYFTGGSNRVEILPLANVNRFETSLFTGAATFSFDLNVPPGPGGLAPRLTLAYNSQSSYLAQRSNYMSNHTAGQGFQSASPYGEGFNITLGSVDLQRVSYDSGQTTQDIWHLNLPGGSYRLIDIGGGQYRTESDQFFRIRKNHNGAAFEVTTKDGTRYRFGTDAVNETDYRINVWWDGNGHPQQSANRYMLSQIVDTHNNTVNYKYARTTQTVWRAGDSGCNDNPENYTPAVYPTEVTYAGGKVRIVFNRTSQDRMDVSAAWEPDRQPALPLRWLWPARPVPPG